MTVATVAFTNSSRRRAAVHDLFIPDGWTLAPMADFLAVLGTIAFILVMLGFIWGLDHV